MAIALAPHVLRFIKTLTGLSPAPLAVWLIGSQANGRATAESDTDLLVFASPEYVEMLRQLDAPSQIDCLVVFNGEDFVDPWSHKNGSLKRWSWRTSSSRHAHYTGSKWVPDEEFGDPLGDLVEGVESAIRVWPE